MRQSVPASCWCGMLHSAHAMEWQAQGQVVLVLLAAPRGPQRAATKNVCCGWGPRPPAAAVRGTARRAEAHPPAQVRPQSRRAHTQRAMPAAPAGLLLQSCAVERGAKLWKPAAPHAAAAPRNRNRNRNSRPSVADLGVGRLGHQRQPRRLADGARALRWGVASVCRQALSRPTLV